MNEDGSFKDEHDELLDGIHNAIKLWAKSARKAVKLEAEHKHKTSATAEVLADKVGATRSKQSAEADPEWLDRQVATGYAKIEEKGMAMMVDHACKKWETWRSRFSKEGKVIR